tara:strand:- start:588 stop:1190 length:603 start_codon:yes stop_codon:yes gene_type:complete
MKSMTYICGPKWDQRVVKINPKGRCAIIMSGGIDSFVLFNLLSLVTYVDVFNVNRQDGFDNYKRVERLTGQKVNIVNELTTNAATRIEYSINQIIKEYNYDEVYAGTNHTPPLAYFPEFDRPDRPKRPWYIDHEKYKLRLPFLHLYKYHIIDLARQEKIDLSDTMSCIASTEKECGKCWQCMEKKWGYDLLYNRNPERTG